MQDFLDGGGSYWRIVSLWDSEVIWSYSADVYHIEVEEEIEAVSCRMNDLRK